jgi:hypothetical protein
MFAFALEIAAAGNFSAMLQSEAVDDQTLRLGMAVGGTDGYDIGLDGFSPPAPQEPVNLDAYFPVSHPLITRLSTDYQAVSDRAAYTLKVRADNDPFTLSWDVSTVSDNFTHVQLIQKSPTVLNPIDMRNQMSLELDSIAGSYYVFEIILSTNIPPIADTKTIDTDEDTVVQIILSASDVEGDPLTYSIVTGPSKGTVSLSGAVVTYSPNADLNGNDSFTFKANDGTVDSNTGSVSVSITAVNDAPAAAGVSLTAIGFQSHSFDLSASDVDSNTPQLHSTTGYG